MFSSYISKLTITQFLEHFFIFGFRVYFIFLCGTLKSETFNNQTDYSASMDGWDGWFENFDWQQYIEGQGSTDVYDQMVPIIR